MLSITLVNSTVGEYKGTTVLFKIPTSDAKPTNPSIDDVGPNQDEVAHRAWWSCTWDKGFKENPTTQDKKTQTPATRSMNVIASINSYTLGKDVAETRRHHLHVIFDTRKIGEVGFEPTRKYNDS